MINKNLQSIPVAPHQFDALCRTAMSSKPGEWQTDPHGNLILADAHGNAIVEFRPAQPQGATLEPGQGGDQNYMRSPPVSPQLYARGDIGPPVPIMLTNHTFQHDPTPGSRNCKVCGRGIADALHQLAATLEGRPHP